jgi:lipoprotein signal peptidase
MNLFYLSICIGGAMGNLIERILYGHVTDFISILRFPIFNLGDSLILIGIIFTLFFSKNEYTVAYNDYNKMIEHRKNSEIKNNRKN